MSATLHYTHGPRFGVVEVTSLAFMENAEPAIRDMAERTRQHGDRRLLINLIDVVGTFGPDEHRAIGILAYRHLAHLERIASLVAPDKVTRVSEAAAQAQGLQLRVFTELTEAIEWLVA